MKNLPRFIAKLVGILLPLYHRHKARHRSRSLTRSRDSVLIISKARTILPCDIFIIKGRATAPAYIYAAGCSPLVLRARFTSLAADLRIWSSGFFGVWAREKRFRRIRGI